MSLLVAALSTGLHTQGAKKSLSLSIYFIYLFLFLVKAIQYLLFYFFYLELNRNFIYLFSIIFTVEDSYQVLDQALYGPSLSHRRSSGSWRALISGTGTV